MLKVDFREVFFFPCDAALMLLVFFWLLFQYRQVYLAGLKDIIGQWDGFSQGFGQLLVFDDVKLGTLGIAVGGDEQAFDFL